MGWGGHRHHRMRSMRFRIMSTGGQPRREINIQNGIWIVSQKWAGNGLRILGRYPQTNTKPLGREAVGLQWCSGYVICDRLERPVVAFVAMNLRSLWTPLLLAQGSTTWSCTVCTITLNLQWWQPQFSSREAAYGDPGSAAIRFIWLDEREEWPSDNRLQFKLQPWWNVSNFDTDTNTNTHSALQASATEQPMMINTSTLFVQRNSSPPRRSVSNSHTDTLTHAYVNIHHHTTGFEHLCLKWNYDQHFHLVCREEVNIATEKRLQFWQYTDTDSATHDWNRETAYGNQRHSSSFE